MIRSLANHAIEGHLDEGVQSANVDGGFTAWLRLDDMEHARRRREGVGAMTSTGLLSGLWELPAGVAVPAEALRPERVRRLRAAPSAAVETEDGFVRSYSPPGVVLAVAFAGGRADRVLGQAIRFTPIVRRFAIVGSASLSRRVVNAAAEWGIGLLQITSDEVRVVVEGAPAELGMPHVYRWWLAENAYDGWLYENAQFCS